MDHLSYCSNCGQRKPKALPQKQKLREGTSFCYICRKLGKKQCDFQQAGRVKRIISQEHSLPRAINSIPLVQQRRPSPGHRTAREGVKRSSSSGQIGRIVFVPVEKRIVYLTPVLLAEDQPAKEYDSAETSTSLRAASPALSSKLARRLEFTDSRANQSLLKRNDEPLRPQDLRSMLLQYHFSRLQ